MAMDTSSLRGSLPIFLGAPFDLEGEYLTVVGLDTFWKGVPDIIRVAGISADSKGTNRIIAVEYDTREAHPKIPAGNGRTLDVSVSDKEFPLPLDTVSSDYRTYMELPSYFRARPHTNPQELIITEAMVRATGHRKAVRYSTEGFVHEFIQAPFNNYVVKAGFTAKTDELNHSITYNPANWTVSSPKYLQR